jgi:alginate O-acetyltransferase complex protein AlgI
MFFHKSEFLIFFLIVFPVYFFLRRHNTGMNVWLLAASYVFYGWWNPWYLVLIAATTTLDWYIGLRLGVPGCRRKFWLFLTLLSNLGMLAFFKYADFVTENLNVLLLKAGAATSVRNPARMLMESLHMEYVLPVGISFFTFQSMSYTIDVYRGQIPVERSLLRFATFVSLFPQLVAGPIERASNLLPQLQSPPPITGQDLAEGASQFLVGLFKKIAMADFLAKYVDRVYNSPAEHNAPALLLATFAFAWQIYFDFSGYTGSGSCVTSTTRTSRRAWETSGTGGTSACRPGSRITSISRWEATAERRSRPTATW